MTDQRYRPTEPITPEEVSEIQDGTYDDIVNMPNECRKDTYPMVMDKDVLRFKANTVVRWLLDRASDGVKTDMNQIWLQHFDLQDLMEFYRMIGYSLCGFSEIFANHLDELAGKDPDEEDDDGE